MVKKLTTESRLYYPWHMIDELHARLKFSWMCQPTITKLCFRLVIVRFLWDDQRWRNMCLVQVELLSDAVLRSDQSWHVPRAQRLTCVQDASALLLPYHLCKARDIALDQCTQRQ